MARNNRQPRPNPATETKNETEVEVVEKEVTEVTETTESAQVSEATEEKASEGVASFIDSVATDKPHVEEEAPAPVEATVSSVDHTPVISVVEKVAKNPDPNTSVALDDISDLENEPTFVVDRIFALRTYGKHMSPRVINTPQTTAAYQTELYAFFHAILHETVYENFNTLWRVILKEYHVNRSGAFTPELLSRGFDRRYINLSSEQIEFLNKINNLVCVTADESKRAEEYARLDKEYLFAGLSQEAITRIVNFYTSF